MRKVWALTALQASSAQYMGDLTRGRFLISGFTSSWAGRAYNALGILLARVFEGVWRYRC